MITPPTAPSPGKPVSAGFFSRLIAWVKSGQLIEGPGYRLKRGPNGTTLVLSPAVKPTSASKLPGCFDFEEFVDESEIRYDDDGNPYHPKKHRLVRCYFMEGGFLMKHYQEPIIIEDEEEKDGFGSDCGYGLLCFRIEYGEHEDDRSLVMFFRNLRAYFEAKKRLDEYLFPLYLFKLKFNEEGKEEENEPFEFVQDFRNAPQIQAFDRIIEEHEEEEEQEEES